MGTFGLLGFIFGLAGMAGVTFSLIALMQVNVLKKDVETLKETVQKIGGESD